MEKMVAHEFGSRDMQTLAGIPGGIENPMLSDSFIFEAPDLGDRLLLATDQQRLLTAA